MTQGTPEWHAARLGRLTASRMADVIAKTKSGPSASRAGYATELALERITGQPHEKFTSHAMQRGALTEPQARAAYELHTGEFVTLADFVPHPSIAMSGASPDGYVGNDGLIEIKCPDSKQHLTYLRERNAPKQYVPQIQWQLACTGRQWCDFVSYDPRFPEGLRLHVVRVARDNNYIQTLEQEAVMFLQEVAAIMQDVTNIQYHQPA